MQPVLFDYQSNSIHTLKFGKGEDLLIVFPGYGDKATTFLKLEKGLAKKYTTYVVDLPKHGETTWSQPQFTPTFFIAIIHLILQTEKRKEFALMGHSYGGRVVLKMIPHFIQQLNRIILIAPDGLKNRDFSPIKNMPVTFRKLVKKWESAPQKTLAMARWLHCKKLLPNHSLAFFERQLSKPYRVERLFLYWLSIPSFQIKPKEIQQILNKEKIPVDVFMGTQDQIIPAHLGIRFCKGLSNANLYLLEEGHLIIGPELNGILTEIQ